MLMKVDIEKTYDSLEWRFIDKALEIWGFSKEFRGMVMSNLDSVEYNILLNGKRDGILSSSRGIIQGDPFSPFLFILSAEIFFRLLDKQQDINGIKNCRTAPAISHLFYADDIMLA